MKWVSHADDTGEWYCCNYNQTNALLTKPVFMPHNQNAVPGKGGGRTGERQCGKFKYLVTTNSKFTHEEVKSKFN
jgi:hypothetical protein